MLREVGPLKGKELEWRCLRQASVRKGEPPQRDIPKI